MINKTGIIIGCLAFGFFVGAMVIDEGYMHRRVTADTQAAAPLADGIFYTDSGPRTFWQLAGRDCRSCNYYYNLETVLICEKCGEKTIQRAYLCRYVKD